MASTEENLKKLHMDSVNKSAPEPGLSGWGEQTSQLAAGQSINGRERLLDRLDVTESRLIHALGKIRELKDRVRYSRDAGLVADLVDEFARLNFLSGV